MRDVVFVGIACVIGVGVARVFMEVAGVWGISSKILVGAVAALIGTYFAVALAKATGRQAYVLFIVVMVGLLTPFWSVFVEQGFTPWAAALAGACAGGVGANLLSRSRRAGD